MIENVFQSIAGNGIIGFNEPKRAQVEDSDYFHVNLSGNIVVALNQATGKGLLVEDGKLIHLTAVREITIKKIPAVSVLDRHTLDINFTHGRGTVEHVNVAAVIELTGNSMILR